MQLRDHLSVIPFPQGSQAHCHVAHPKARRCEIGRRKHIRGSTLGTKVRCRRVLPRQEFPSCLPSPWGPFPNLSESADDRTGVFSFLLARIVTSDEFQRLWDTVAARDLGQVISKLHEWPFRVDLLSDVATHIINGIACALNHCHLSGVLHLYGSVFADTAQSQPPTVAAFSEKIRLFSVCSDVKPANVRVSSLAFGGEYGVPVLELADLGLAWPLEPGSEYAVVPRDRGTQAYIAPEVKRGVAYRTSDVYSLGMTIWELLSGSLPTAADLVASQTPAFLSTPPRGPISNGSCLLYCYRRDWRLLLQRALNQNPQLRPSIGELLQMTPLCQVAYMSPAPNFDRLVSSMDESLQAVMAARESSQALGATAQTQAHAAAKAPSFVPSHRGGARGASESSGRSFTQESAASDAPHLFLKAQAHRAPAPSPPAILRSSGVPGGRHGVSSSLWKDSVILPHPPEVSQGGDEMDVDSEVDLNFGSTEEYPALSASQLSLPANRSVPEQTSHCLKEWGALEVCKRISVWAHRIPSPDADWVSALSADDAFKRIGIENAKFRAYWEKMGKAIFGLLQRMRRGGFSDEMTFTFISTAGRDVPSKKKKAFRTKLRALLMILESRGVLPDTPNVPQILHSEVH